MIPPIIWKGRYCNARTSEHHSKWSSFHLSCVTGLWTCKGQSWRGGSVGSWRGSCWGAPSEVPTSRKHVLWAKTKGMWSTATSFGSFFPWRAEVIMSYISTSVSRSTWRTSATGKTHLRQWWWTWFPMVQNRQERSVEMGHLLEKMKWSIQHIDDDIIWKRYGQRSSRVYSVRLCLQEFSDSKVCEDPLKVTSLSAYASELGIEVQFLCDLW